MTKGKYSPQHEALVSSIIGVQPKSPDSRAAASSPSSALKVTFLPTFQLGFSSSFLFGIIINRKEVQHKRKQKRRGLLERDGGIVH